MICDECGHDFFDHAAPGGGACSHSGCGCARFTEDHREDHDDHEK